MGSDQSEGEELKNTAGVCGLMVPKLPCLCWVFLLEVSMDGLVCVVSEERVKEEDVLGRGGWGSSSSLEVSDELAKWPITLGRLNFHVGAAEDAMVVASEDVSRA